MKTFEFTAKCRDLFDATTKTGYYDGYVPDNLGIGGGDYLSISVDIETGCIIGWNKEAVLKFMENPLG